MAADLAAAQRRLRESKGDPAAPSPTTWALPELDGTSASSRALGGFNHTFPLIGVVAAFSTVELMQREKTRFSVDTLSRGCMKGVIRWLPFGVGAALYYSMEYTLRPLHYRFVSAPESSSASLRTSLPADVFNRANLSSKVTAGLTAGVIISVPLHLLRWQGMRTWSGVTGLTLAAGIGGAFMPEYEQFDNALW